MIRRYFLPALAGVGVLFAIFVVVRGNRPVPAADPAGLPPQSPYAHVVAGKGLVEANSENIAIAANVPGVITDVYVKVGDPVKAGAPLFKLDERNLKATLAVQEATLGQAREKLARLKSMPRPEEIPPAAALVREAQANLSDMKNQFDLAQSVGDSRAISREELARRRFAMQAAESKLVNAQANLDLLKAGSWKADISVAQTDLEYAAAQVKATGIEIDRLTVKAPVDGEVMQLNARVAEYAQAGPLSVPLILFGNTGTLRVRVDIDENEAWRVRPNADAWAYIRGNRDLKTQLKFEHIEPYIIPKRSLTGESTERVDTRVLQVIYSFQPGKFPVYVGQQMDVNIDAGDAAKAVASK
ncbi:MAG: hypothetical protein JWL69_4422 [Phycisphaerales bacterium]|nr:hypothetical protein [Phycisphaerales bacterium]MDB5353624.1 hypothetical protein [Phycisphaerales bacterium]